MSPWFENISVFCALAIVAWMLSAIFIQQSKNRLPPENTVLRIARWIFHELKPFFLTVAIVRFGTSSLPVDSWLWAHVIVFGIDCLNWYFYKDIDDDDRWQRRKQKLLDKITITDGKLAVIPA